MPEPLAAMFPSLHSSNAVSRKRRKTVSKGSHGPQTLHNNEEGFCRLFFFFSFLFINVLYWPFKVLAKNPRRSLSKGQKVRSPSCTFQHFYQSLDQWHRENVCLTQGWQVSRRDGKYTEDRESRAKKINRLELQQRGNNVIWTLGCKKRNAQM